MKVSFNGRRAGKAGQVQPDKAEWPHLRRISKTNDEGAARHARAEQWRELARDSAAHW